MIWVWIYVVVGLLTVGLAYFEITGPVMQFLNYMQVNGAPEWFITLISRGYHGAFIILCVGILLYGLLNSVKTEPDTYRV